MNGVNVLMGGTIKLLQMDDTSFVKLEDFEKLEADNAELDRKIELYKKALLILGGELDKWKCPGEDADDEALDLIGDRCENECDTSSIPECWKIYAERKAEKEANNG